MGGNNTQSTRETTTTSLPANQQRNVDTLMQGVLDYYSSGGRSYFPGDTVADFNPTQLAGQEHLLGFAGGTGQDFADQALASNMFFMDPNNVFNPGNIPGYGEAQDALTRRMTQNLTENILPHVRGGGTASGQFGGTAQGIGEALSVGRTNEGLSSALANMDLGAYQAGLGAFDSAMARAPGMFQLGASPGTIMASVGDATQNQEQREIDADFARHMFGENEQVQILQLLQALTGGAGTYGGTTEGTSTTSQSGGSPLTQALGLGLMGMGVMNPAAAGAGAAGKGAASGGGSVAPMAFMGR